jgi:hypothetical protein
MPLLDKTRRRRKRRSINLFGLLGRKRNSRAYTLKRRRGERKSHFKKATSFAREARGPRATQPDEPANFTDPDNLYIIAKQEGPLGAYARSLLRQQQDKRAHVKSAQRDNGAIGNNYVEPVELDDPGKWHIMARQDGLRGAYAQRLLSQHMAETRRTSSARNKGALPP